MGTNVNDVMAMVAPRKSVSVDSKGKTSVRTRRKDNHFQKALTDSCAQEDKSVSDDYQKTNPDGKQSNSADHKGQASHKSVKEKTTTIDADKNDKVDGKKLDKKHPSAKELEQQLNIVPQMLHLALATPTGLVSATSSEQKLSPVPKISALVSTLADLISQYGQERLVVDGKSTTNQTDSIGKSVAEKLNLLSTVLADEKLGLPQLQQLIAGLPKGQIKEQLLLLEQKLLQGGNVTKQTISVQEMLKVLMKTPNSGKISQQTLPFAVENVRTVDKQSNHVSNKQVDANVAKKSALSPVLNFYTAKVDIKGQAVVPSEAILKGATLTDYATKKETATSRVISSEANNSLPAFQLAPHWQAPSVIDKTVEAPDSFQNISRQIVQNAKLLHAPDHTQMVIHLQPEHLGELALKISVEANGVVSASFHSDNEQVRNLLETSLVQLKQDLQLQGIKVDNINVYSGLNDLLYNQQQKQREQVFTSPRKVRKVGSVEAIEEMENLEHLASLERDNTLTSEAVDYRI